MSMLSLTKGRPIAIIEGGQLNGKTIYLYDPSVKCCDNCSENCGKRGKFCCIKCAGTGGCLDNNKPQIAYDDIFDILDEDFIRKGSKKLSWNDISILKNAIKKKQPPNDPKLLQIYGAALKELDERSSNEFFLNDNGNVMVLPRCDKTERIYVAGPSDSGKSYWCKHYIEQWIKMFPKRKIFLFSDVEEDKELDSLPNMYRIIINKELVEKPLQSSDFPDGSLVLFDDIDSIQDKPVLKAVETLRDHLLRRGRHESLYIIVSNHLITDYKTTRVVLNEATSYVFFPRSGASHGIEYLLRRYCGLDTKQIYKVMHLNSRWVCVNKNAPMFITYSKGVYLL